MDVIGSGLIASAFSEACTPITATIYAAGVSNSSNQLLSEFSRERGRLASALSTCDQDAPFVYFSTCSVEELHSSHVAYVQHKLAMESLVLGHSRGRVFRLPQVAGRTPNPHTLLNFLYAKIARSEHFQAWKSATRNIIDVEDVVRLVLGVLVDRERTLPRIVNIANPVSVGMPALVAMFEEVIGKTAVCTWIEKGSEHLIDTQAISPLLSHMPHLLDCHYLHDVLCKYYRASDIRQ